MARYSSRKWEEGQTFRKAHWQKGSWIWRVYVKALYAGHFALWGLESQRREPFPQQAFGSHRFEAGFLLVRGSRLLGGSVLLLYF